MVARVEHLRGTIGLSLSSREVRAQRMAALASAWRSHGLGGVLRLIGRGSPVR